jgi:hypothetical protein
MFNLGDFGWFKKKFNSGENSRDFRYTKGNCKHYGSKAADIFAGIAAIGFLVPLIIDIFNKDSKDDLGNNNGKTRKR